MTTTGRDSRTRRALTMALYTFLLALGAALPMAASYRAELRAAGGEGQLETGGYAQRVEADATDEDLAAERPREHVAVTSAIRG